jgi:hypothetical protein
MPTIALKNASPVTIHGKRPGQVFHVDVDASGTPLDVLWQRRLLDEQLYRSGHIVPAPVKPVPVAPQPVAAPVAAAVAPPVTAPVPAPVTTSPTASPEVAKS